MKKFNISVAVIALFVCRAGAQENAVDEARSVQDSTAAISSYGGGIPDEVVIKGEESQKLNTLKPPLRLEIDNFESIKPSLEPESRFFLAESPLSLSRSRNRPEILHNTRVIQPWRTSFSDTAGITFSPRKKLEDIFRGQLDENLLKEFQWTLSVADEEGRVFQKYSGSGEPPQELVWSGQNSRNEWIKAGHSYSAVYMFTDASGSPHTGVGNPLQFTGIVHQEQSGLHISLDSVVMFGPTKSETRVQKPFGEHIMMSASDLIKRRYYNVPIRVHSYAQSKMLADQQAALVMNFLSAQLMLPNNMLSAEGHEASFAEQRVDIVLINR